MICSINISYKPIAYNTKLQMKLNGAEFIASNASREL